MKEYHKKIAPILKEIVSPKKHLEICPKRRPLKINHPIKTFSMNYYPDFYFLNNRNNKYCVFEILDTQPKTKTIADIFRIISLKNCYLAIFIVKDDEIRGDVELIIDTFKLILSDIIQGKNKNIKLNKKALLNIICETVEEKLIKKPKKLKTTLNKIVFKK